MSGPSDHSKLTKLLSVVIIGLLGLALSVGISPKISKKLKDIGESNWSEYASKLRNDPVKPECQQNIESWITDRKEAGEPECNEKASLPAVQKPIEPPKEAQEDDDEDLFDDDDDGDLFDDSPAEKTPPAQTEDDTEDLFDDDEDEDSKSKPSTNDDEDLFDDDDDEDPSEDDLFDDDDDGSTSSGIATKKSKTTKQVKSKRLRSCEAIQRYAQICQTEIDEYESTMSRITPSVKQFRSFEMAVSDLIDFKWWKHLLALLVLIGALCATINRHHIGLRTPKSILEHRISQGAQLTAGLLWLVSCYLHYQKAVADLSTADPQNLEIIAALHRDAWLPRIWIIGFSVLCAVNVYHLIKPPPFENKGSTLPRMLMVSPLFAYMSIIAGLWFWLGENHPTGQAIFLDQFTDTSKIFIGIGLYIWAGMMFATTRIAKLFFDILTPWALPVSILAWLVVVLAAVPTAYSGASGIFVIAAGAVIFERLRAAGADKRLALSATAMSGSLGVVLSPCLIVVLISILNKSVTTAELFSKGLWVYGLAVVLLLVAMIWRSKEPFRIEKPSVALPKSIQAFRPLLPYAAVGFVVVALYGYGLNTWINETTAPFILPGIFLALVAVERRFIVPNKPEEADQRGLWKTLTDATTEGSSHIGALLIVMAGSIGLGGVIERANVMDLFPADLGSPVLVMAILVLIMIILGMIMDALGGVILVSATLAAVAENYGIDPVHFWMMVLAGFELGYLTPPVALNHLLARQVIGSEAHIEDDDVEGFWARTEHLWLPMLVMGVRLLIVAFVPFFFYTAVAGQ